MPCNANCPTAAINVSIIPNGRLARSHVGKRRNDNRGREGDDFCVLALAREGPLREAALERLDAAFLSRDFPRGLEDEARRPIQR